MLVLFLSLLIIHLAALSGGVCVSGGGRGVKGGSGSFKTQGITTSLRLKYEKPIISPPIKLFCCR